MSQEHEKEQSDHAVFTFGRFNPVTTGHKKLVDHVINVARQHGADHYIFASHSHDAKKNPLSYHQKIHFIKKMMPYANAEKTPGVKTAIDAVKHLHKKGYKKITMIVGGDRVQEFHNLLHKYNGKEYNVEHLKVQSAGTRDPDSEGVQGMSASKMRAHAQAGNFAAFKKGTPRHEHAEELYHTVRKGMKLESILHTNKAIFLVGAPGSGKDMILSAVLENTKLLEMPLEKLFQAIGNRQDLPEMVGNPSLIVNGTAEAGQKVQITKQVLEAMGYATAMVYVHTTNDESKRRNEQRIAAGAKTISEEVRSSKYSTAQVYMRTYAKSFDPFYLFDNSTDLRGSVNEQKKNELLGWLVELGEGISRFLAGKDVNKLFENISASAVDNSVGATGGGASNSPTENPANIIQKPRGNPKRNIMKDMGGTAKADNNSFQGPNVEESVQNDGQVASSESPQSIKKFPQGPSITKNKKKKVATPPPAAFNDSRLGSVPSGGIGLVSNSYQPKGRTISELRKNINSYKNNVDE